MKALRSVCLALLLLASAPALFAQAYPERPVRVIVPVPAGGTPDIIARMVMPGVTSAFGQQFIVDNRAGAGGLIAAEMAAHAAPDGYTLFFSSPGALTILPYLQKKNVSYDAVRDFAPVSLAAIGPFFLLAHPSVPVDTLKQLLALAKAKPGGLTYASAGSGTANHLAMELFKSMAGVEILHVPYRGAPQAITDLIGGNINLMFSSIPPVVQHIKNGRLKLLGVSSAKRSPQMPEVPTISEAGVPEYESTTWFGLLAPAKTPQAIIARLNAAMVKAVNAPELKTQLAVLGYDPVGGSAAEFAQFIQAEATKNEKVVKFSGAKVD